MTAASPCRGCERRSTACHATCGEYAEFAARKREEYDRRARAALAAVEAPTSSHLRAIRRAGR